jgi:hypothetical protein
VLFADRADDRDPDRCVALGGLDRGTGEARQRPLRVDRAPAVQLAALDPDRDLAGHRVDMTEQDDMPIAGANPADRVAHCIDFDAQAVLGHPTGQERNRIGLIRAGARDCDQIMEQADSLVLGQHVLCQRLMQRG